MILVGFNFPPVHNFRTLKNNDGSSSSDLVINTRNSRKWPGLAITHDWMYCLLYYIRCLLKQAYNSQTKAFKQKRRTFSIFHRMPVYL